MLKQVKKVSIVSMMDIFKNPRYRGKHIILAAGKIYTAKTGEGASEILKEIREKLPDITPEIAYILKFGNWTLHQLLAV